MQEFTPRPVNQAGAQGEEAGRRIANGGERVTLGDNEPYATTPPT